jgi:hypothetical protein
VRVGDAVLVDVNVTLRGGLETVDAPQQRALSATGRSDDKDYLPTGNGQRCVFHRFDRTKSLGHVFYSDSVNCHRVPTFLP